VILGAGRNVRGDVPTAMVNVDGRGCVLDWLLSAFSALPSVEVAFVSGFMAGEVMDRYRGIRFVYNPFWESTGPAKSLSLAPLASTTATYVSYADVVFRPDTVRQMEAAEADLVLAVDGRWRHRYDGRSRPELDGAEKVVCQQDRILDIGSHVPSSRASAEFAGVLRLSGAAAGHLQDAVASGVFAAADGLPEVIRFLIDDGLAALGVDVNGQWAELNAPQDLARFVLGTKAESLERLRPLLRAGRIGDLVAFTHRQWEDDRSGVLERIRQAFDKARVIIRSSALSEDNWLQSSAGAYKSIPDLPADDPETLTAAVEEVLTSYGTPLPQNQVLVQEMLRDVTVSGVVMTRTPAFGAPYYVINYDETTTRTDTVTSGEEAPLRTVVLHREAALGSQYPPELRHLMDVVQELEALVRHDSLDIEFAFTADGLAHVLQVRPIVVGHLEQRVDDARIAAGIEDAVRFLRELQQPSPFVLGRSTQLSVMSDWNPAEIIGTKPGRLAFSLYRHLVTDEVWARQRAEYGYRDVRPRNLLVDILGHPYIDVRASFNSFVPAALPDDLACRLVEHYLDHLKRCPQLHDKVEFDVLFTCLTFDFDRRADRLRRAGFSDGDVERLRQGLLEITRNAMARCAADVAAIEEARRRFERLRSAALAPLERAYLLLDDTRLHGVCPFAHLARGAFVAMALLRSLRAVGATTHQQTDAYLASLRTVSGGMQQDACAVAAGAMAWGEFVDRYGHLRPGTYDITSPHYGSALEEFLRPVVRAARQSDSGEARGPHPWDAGTRRTITAALDRLGLGADVDAFDHFLRQAIEGREFGKFVFTRNLSAALGDLAEFGTSLGVSAEELAQVRIQELFALRCAAGENVADTLTSLAAAGREAFRVTQAVCLPGQIFSEADLTCFEQSQAAPNFVTRKKVRARLRSLAGKGSPQADLSGRIVLIPSADPGFDWIFSRDLAGLVTMYGGANSHMAIRAAEFQLPAAIGIGELLYHKVAVASMVELDCGSRQIRVVE